MQFKRSEAKIVGNSRTLSKCFLEITNACPSVFGLASGIEKKFSFILGEWYLNVTAGIPYLAQKNNDRDDNTKNFFVKNPNLAWINGIFILNLNDINTIDRILSFSSSLDTNIRKFNISYEVVLINGELLSDTLQVSPI